MPEPERKSLAAIDINNLDKEWAGHPERVESVGYKTAKAKRKVAEAKQRLKVVEAELKEQIRGNPDQYGLDKKPSDDRCKDVVVLQPDHQAAVAALIQAEYDHDMVKALFEALAEQKKNGLKDMVYLWGQTYFARLTEKRK